MARCVLGTIIPMTKTRSRVCIVTPALADANNGNWQTARRWASMLGQTYRVNLVPAWPHPGVDAPDVLLALHARRSAASIAAWAQRYPQRPLLVALTGTDLYRDIAHDSSAQHALTVAHQLIVLQEAGPQQLPHAHQHKCSVVFQSSTSRKPLVKTRHHLNVVVVGHLREEKSPHTVFEVARHLKAQDGIHIKHIGDALEPALGQAAQDTAQLCPHYQWVGGLSHSQTRQAIQRAHVLLHPSQMEGGAHVVMEAITSGTPVLASHVAGNVGMLGPEYGGYFPWNDSSAATALLRQCRHSLDMDLHNPHNLLTQLTAQCEQRAPLFAPVREALALQTLVARALASVPQHNP